MIRHQRVRVHLDVFLSACVAKCREEKFVVVLTPENVRSVISTLYDMLRESLHLEAVSASHVAA